MSGSLFSLRSVTLSASGERDSPDVVPLAVSKCNQGIDVPRSPGTRLHSVTLEISSCATAVVGLSGAGKTSLLNILSGFEKQYSGGFTSHLLCSDRRLPLFWVPQSGGLWPHLTAKQHLEVVADTDSKPQSASESRRFSKRTDELLHQFDLTHRGQALPAELSQGERSRLALARALATRAHVLLLDEPLSHVDPVRKPSYWNVVRRIVAEENISMIFTSHEPETVLRQAEHVICLHEGAVAFKGSVKTLYDNPPGAFVGAFLGPLNWFSATEAGAFLDDGSDVGIRPERLQIGAAVDSGIELVSTPFVGAYCESILRHVATGMRKSVLHQVPSVMPSPGDRIVLRRVGAVV